MPDPFEDIERLTAAELLGELRDRSLSGGVVRGRPLDRIIRW